MEDQTTVTIIRQDGREQDVTDILSRRRLRINITDYDGVRHAAKELETLAISAKASADRYREAVRSVAAKANIDASVLSAWVKARISEAPEKKAKQAAQLSLLFEEFGE